MQPTITVAMHNHDTLPEKGCGSVCVQSQESLAAFVRNLYTQLEFAQTNSWRTIEIMLEINEACDPLPEAHLVIEHVRNYCAYTETKFVAVTITTGNPSYQRDFAHLTTLH